MSACQISARGRFGNENGAHISRRSAARCPAQLAPDWVFGDQDTCAGMLEQLPLFVWREFVIERNQNAASVKNRVSGNQPFGLIRHDNAGSIARGEARALQRLRQRMSARFEVPVSDPLFFSLAVSLNQAHF